MQNREHTTRQTIYVSDFETDERYIDSTTITYLCERFGAHRYDYKRHQQGTLESNL